LAPTGHVHGAVGKQNGAAMLAELDPQQASLQATFTNKGISLMCLSCPAKYSALCMYKVIVRHVTTLSLMQVAWPDMVHSFRPSLIVDPVDMLGGLHKDVLKE